MPRSKKLSFEKERKKLEKIINQLPKEKVDLAEQLEKLREEIREAGTSEEYKHGKDQYGTKETVAVGVYLKMQKNYAATIKQLNDMLPDTPAVVPGSELMAFVSGR